MLTLPPEIMTVLMPFTQAFSVRIWDWAQVLLVGAILAPGKRCPKPKKGERLPSLK